MTVHEAAAHRNFLSEARTWDSGETGMLYPTDFAPRFSEEKCSHCPSVGGRFATKILLLVSPRYSHDAAGNRAKRDLGNTMFQLVCDEHATPEYIESRNRPAPKAPRAGRLRRNAR